MRFEILERDGLARTGELEIDGSKYGTPAIAFVDTERYPAPRGALRMRTVASGEKGDVLVAPSAFQKGVTSEEEKRSHLRPGFRGSPYADPVLPGDLLCPDSVASLLLDSREFANSVQRLKTGAHILKPVHCSVTGLPHRLALLSYCGFDLFDSVPLIMASENGGYLTSTGVLEYDKLRDLPCSCPACSSEKRDREQLLRHNYLAAEMELRLVRHEISAGRLRELVENRVRADPWLVQNLRLLDIEHYELQELHAPIKGAPFHAGSKESLTRPDIVRWRRRLEERYRKPVGTRILLLIPCSARKPYSFSQSHARFREAVEKSGKSSIVHEVIVTSPLGLVPRELELFYPAQDYDIPVTGHWDRDERKLAEDMVSWLVSSQKYDLVISHLGDEREPVNSVLRDFVDTSNGSPGTRESLDRLENAISSSGVDASDSSAGTRRVEDMRSACRFQFGGAGEGLCDGVGLAGRYPNIKILRAGAQLGMLTGARGMVSLTMEGAKVIAGSGSYCVEIDDFVPKGNLFAVGVEASSPEIRIGDDVAVVHNGDVRAVGVATMTPLEMVEAERGEAVHIRHVH